MLGAAILVISALGAPAQAASSHRVASRQAYDYGATGSLPGRAANPGVIKNGPQRVTGGMRWGVDGTPGNGSPSKQDGGR